MSALLEATKNFASLEPDWSLDPGQNLRSEYIDRRRQAGVADPEVCHECEPVDFVYADSDAYNQEIAELYAYCEQDDFIENQAAFSLDCGEQRWCTLDSAAKRSYVQRLLDQLDTTNCQLRLRALRSAAYLAQGCYGECSDEKQWAEIVTGNCVLMFELGMVGSLLTVLHFEINNPATLQGVRQKQTLCIADCIYMRLALDTLYTIVETLRHGPHITALSQELMSGGADLLALKLFDYVSSFCASDIPHLPIRKVLLLLWKVILVTLGGWEDLERQKNEHRVAAGLPPITEDTIRVSERLRPSSPPPRPPSHDDATEEVPRRAAKAKQAAKMTKQAQFDADRLTGAAQQLEQDGQPRDPANVGDVGPCDTPRPGSPVQPLPPIEKKLPWKPKITSTEIEMFVNMTRQKFVGFKVAHDQTSLTGLPLPIHQSVATLRANVYKSLTEIQSEREDRIQQYPISQAEQSVPETNSEIMYRALYPNMSHYMIALLKVLLAASPAPKKKADSSKVSCVADCMPEQMPSTAVGSMVLAIDVNRHKQILVKAIASILLLLLKHFKLNHVYQFEFMSQHLVFANCVPLILKFLGQDMAAFVTTRYDIPSLAFPASLLLPPAEVTVQQLEQGLEGGSYSWRNLYSSINLLRVLNKLIKWKPSRVVMLVVFKSSPVLKRALKVRHATMQLYVLKLLKQQTKFLGRQWRRNNMKVVSAIYEKVRHRFVDDWAYGNDQDPKPWDFQQDECTLRNRIESFNQRRYGNSVLITPDMNIDWTPVDNSLWSCLSQPIALSPEFKAGYETWLRNEVFGNRISWEKFLDAPQLKPIV